MRPSNWTSFALTAFLALQPGITLAQELNVSAFTDGLIESDWTSTYYSDSEPLLLGNDGGASTGGFHAWDVDGDAPLQSVVSRFTGRTKLVSTIYNVNGNDYMVSIPATTSVLSLYNLPELTKVENVGYTLLGDWSTICAWTSRSHNKYFFVFGKTDGIQFLVREHEDSLEIVKIQTFAVPTEFAGCAVSHSLSQMFLLPDGGTEILYIDLAESTSAPEFSVLGETEDTITGVAMYVSKSNGSDYLFVAQESAVTVYAYPWEPIGTLSLVGLEEPEIQGLSLYQAATTRYPQGVLAYAAEAEDFAGFALSSLEGVLQDLSIEANTEYDPRLGPIGCGHRSPINKECSFSGFATKDSGSCDCFQGFEGGKCESFMCENECSGHGSCVGPELCQCEDQWGGLECGFLLVEPEYETEANGSDGDDPAIWISPISPELSRIVTTTKSEAGAGLGVFDLNGNQLQVLLSEQPNNVDMIYGFKAGSRTVDLAFAACRGDNTLCLFEMTQDGVLKNIPGGSHPVEVEDEVYGSCVYRSQKTGKQYLFVNEKTARYMQFELTSSANGTLETTLVREFVGGSGGQVEGCVVDEDNAWILLGEEPYALWRYDAEPDGSDEGYRVAFVGDGHLRGDVEGVTLVQGATPDDGFIFVSCQGVSAYNVYGRAAPHDYIMTFTITDSADGQIDHVTNTDGIAAVGANMGPNFPHGLLVVHDDTNELPEGGADTDASYKLIGLDKILGAAPFKSLNLLGQVDENWDPRA